MFSTVDGNLSSLGTSTALDAGPTKAMADATATAAIARITFIYDLPH
jgi:hypothetical protein